MDKREQAISYHIFRCVPEDAFTGRAFITDCPIRSRNKDQSGRIVEKELKVLCLRTFRPSRKYSYAHAVSSNCEVNPKVHP